MQSEEDVGHAAALLISLCPSHPTVRGSFSSISRLFQLRLPLLGGWTHALLGKLGMQGSAQRYGEMMRIVASKVASSLARHVFRCFNEEADRQWVAFIAMNHLWKFLEPMDKFIRSQRQQRPQ